IDKYEKNQDSYYLYHEFKINQNDTLLACIGRLTTQKGHKYLLNCLKLLEPNYPRLIVLIVGDGEERESLINLAEKLSVKNILRFIGHREDIPQILHISDGLILASVFEGLPLCILEAMAASKPVIATDVGGVRELVIDQETGFLVPPKDINALAAAITKLISLPDCGGEMGKKGRELVRKKFSIQMVAKRTVDLFLELHSQHAIFFTMGIDILH
ncbi:MAG: glycosyltransferase, partial [bacterium]